MDIQHEKLDTPSYKQLEFVSAPKKQMLAASNSGKPLEMTMNSFVCPKCSSKYFMIRVDGEKRVFTLAQEHQMQPADGKGEIVLMDFIHCGACSWNGQLHDTMKTELE